jgi:hypothetical protein
MEQIMVRKAIADTGCCQTVQGLSSTELILAIVEVFCIMQKYGQALGAFINLDKQSIEHEEKVASRPACTLDKINQKAILETLETRSR